MKIIIMAGGLAKRLWPLTKDLPKPLLEIGRKAVLTRIMEKVQALGADRVIIVVNERFLNKFRDWATRDGYDNVKFITVPVGEEKDDMGALGALDFAIKAGKVYDDLFLINGDNIFDFDLLGFIRFAKERLCIGLYDTGSREEAKNLGVVGLDGDRVAWFEEKPKEPRTTLVSTGMYFIPKSSLGLLDRYLKGGNDPGMLGYFIKWLLRATSVYGFVFRGKWFDIGTFETLERAKKCFK